MKIARQVTSVFAMIITTVSSPSAFAKDQPNEWTDTVGRMKVPVYYVTDRKMADGSSGHLFEHDYLASPNVCFGKCYVDMTRLSHTNAVADVMKDYGWQASDKPKDAETVVEPAPPHSANIDGLSADPYFESDVIAPIETWRSKELPDRKGVVFIFIHGFSSPFDSAVRDAAQLATWSKCPVIAYVWATPPKLHYLEASIVWEQSHQRLIKFIEQMERKFGTENLVLVAHSMGNRLLDHVLQLRSFEDSCPDKPLKQFREVDMVFADVDAQAFAQRADRIAKNAKLTRIYVSGDQDDVIGLSRTAHLQYRRVGAPADHLSPIYKESNIDIIDVSGLAKAKGHPLGRTGHSVPFWLVANMTVHNRPGLESEFLITDPPSPRTLSVIETKHSNP